MTPAGRPSFAALLRQILVDEQSRKLKDVAAEVGLSSRNFYGRVTGRIQFTPDEINRVLRAVPDPRLGDWLLAQSGLTCVARVGAATVDAPPAELALRAVEQAMAALRCVLRAEGAAAVGHVAEAQRQLAALLGAVE
jgi:hypothetical protein